MDGLEHIVRSETEDLQDLTDDAVLHTQEMYNKAHQTFSEFDEKGKTFLQNSATVCNKKHLVTYTDQDYN